MIRVAYGEKLAIRQSDVKINGWAMEARVYAEDPFRNFLPSTGRLVQYRQPPAHRDHVRVDTGVYEGGEISMFYDPMIAKLVTWGKDRNTAIDAMRGALDEFYIRGVSHNIPFLAALMAHPRFVEGRLTTNFIAEEYKSGFTTADLPPADPQMLAAVAAAIHRAYAERDAQVSGRLLPYRQLLGEDWTVLLDRKPFEAAVTPAKESVKIKVGKKKFDIQTFWQLGDPLFRASVNGHEICVQVDRVGVGYRLYHSAGQAEVLVLRPEQAKLAALMPVKLPPDTSKFLLSPMPGLLVSLAVKEGQEVKAGEALAVVEAMKMENVLKALRDGTIGAIHAKPGESLRVDQKILEFA